MNKIFSQSFFSNFFFKFFCQNFPKNFFWICFEGFTRETHACCENPTRDFSRYYMNENFFGKFFFPIFFLQIFLSKFSSKFFLRIFFQFFSNLFSKFFCQNFAQNFFSEFLFKIFSGFVSRVSHARQTRVASTPRGIFLVII